MQTAIQLYTVRDVEKSLPEILADVGETTFDGVEFAHRADEEDPADLRRAMDAAGLEAASAHVGIDAMEADFGAVTETARALGYDDVIVPWLDPEHFETVGAVERTADRLTTLADQASDQGLRLHYHNHDQEFAETDAGLAFDLLADLTEDVLFEVDAGWALAGGVDPAELIERYGHRITHVHAKDVFVDSEDVPALGEGDLDLEAVVAAARDADADWLVYENDEPADPTTAHRHGSDVLSRYV